MAVKYELPLFLEGHVTREKYGDWLHKKSNDHTKRDRKRLGTTIANADYKRQIHEAVCSSNGVDWYTGEELQWAQISTYNNDEFKAGRSNYKARFALMPTIDHVKRQEDGWDFLICGWRTNDAKNDLSLAEFLSVCRLVIARRGQEAEAAAELTGIEAALAVSP